MGAFKVYVKTFDVNGNYESDFVDVSKEVLKLSDIKENLDSTEYDLGIFRLNGIKISLRNDHGRFSSPPNSRSIFKFKTKDTQVKVTWNIRAEPLCVGFFKAGACGPLGEEIEVFRGLIAETTSESDIESQTVKFDVLGLESLLERVTVPYGDISVSDDISDVIFNILNQAQITNLLTVDALNINPGLDQAIDAKNALENKTGKEALGKEDSLLFLSQSVLTTKNQIIEVKTRDATADVKHNFYGPASQLGNENIVGIDSYREGFNSVVNFWTWDDTSLNAQSTSSVAKYGIQKKALRSEVLTNTTKRQNILNSLRNEFSEPKKELVLIAPLTKATANLSLLDKVDIDYPTIYVPADGGELPLWGSSIWGEFVWPIGSFELTISQTTKFKILARTIKVKDETIEFKLREV